MASDSPALVMCNGASIPSDATEGQPVISLDYRDSGDGVPNVRLGLPDFVRNLYHLPDRVLDLLELAAYVYCADRMTRRGRKDALEYRSWARMFRFEVKVRDHAFWSRQDVSFCLSRALEFMTGDQEYSFSFHSGHSTPQADLFDDERFQVDSPENVEVTLFSGGLDSLAGALNHLETTTRRVCLVSHQSQPGTAKTQRGLVEALREHYPDRVSHYRFECNLKGVRAAEETQRSRAFLYTTIAFAISKAFNQSRFSVYENGITSINFPRRADLALARASRTTHPRTIFHLQELFTLVGECDMEISLPLLWQTKTDVLAQLLSSQHPELIPSSVSCSKTFQNLGPATHCGICSQCVDRRFASYAAKAEDIDEAGLYAIDFIPNAISDREAKTTVVDYVRQAKDFGTWNDDHFFVELAAELADVVDYLPGGGPEMDRIRQVASLCKRHGDQVALAMSRMRDAHDDLYAELPRDSLLGFISDREYMKDPAILLVERLCDLLDPAVGQMFAVTRPKDEPDLNTKVSTLLSSHEIKLRSEHPAVSFAGMHTVPDHGSDHSDVLIESKYVRGATTPGKVSDAMAADVTKYPQRCHILFLVYDPERKIKDDQSFRNDFENRGHCTVLIIR